MRLNILLMTEDVASRTKWMSYVSDLAKTRLGIEQGVTVDVEVKKITACQATNLSKNVKQK